MALLAGGGRPCGCRERAWAGKEAPMEPIQSLQDAIDRFEQADPNHPPRQGFGTPLALGIIAYAVVLVTGVAVYIVFTVI